MKENVLDVLLYLFENFIYDDPESGRDRDSLQNSLLEAGFNPAEISKAFDWLDGLAAQRPGGELAFGATGPVRVYAEEEMRWLDPECRGFLMYLEHNGILDAARRELVVERVLALDAADFDLDDLKWVVLMVLFNQPDQEAACAWMENYLFEGADAEH
jgi:Smg protein